MENDSFEISDAMRKAGTEDQWLNSVYEKLAGKPSINGVELNGDKTSADLYMYTKEQINDKLEAQKAIDRSQYATQLEIDGNDINLENIAGALLSSATAPWIRLAQAIAEAAKAGWSLSFNSSTYVLGLRTKDGSVLSTVNLSSLISGSGSLAFDSSTYILSLKGPSGAVLSAIDLSILAQQPEIPMYLGDNDNNLDYPVGSYLHSGVDPILGVLPINTEVVVALHVIATASFYITAPIPGLTRLNGTWVTRGGTGSLMLVQRIA